MTNPHQHRLELVHITPDAEATIAYLARVSNPDATPDQPSDRLLRYLIRHEHWSPFEMASMCVRITTTRSIAAQILRHRSFSFQEFSQRYSDPTAYIMPELRMQATNNRQSSEPLTDPVSEGLKSVLDRNLQANFNVYTMLVNSGYARETARDFLPLATKTTLYMHGTIRSWLHYINLRTKPDTQLEHRLLAEQARSILVAQLPTVAEAMWPTPPAAPPVGLLGRLVAWIARIGA